MSVTITAHATGWNIEATGTGSPYPFTASLPACPDPDGHKGHQKFASCPTGYHLFHVERLVAAVAKSYGRRTEAPAVPVLPA